MSFERREVLISLVKALLVPIMKSGNVEISQKVIDKMAGEILNHEQIYRNMSYTCIYTRMCT